MRRVLRFLAAAIVGLVVSVLLNVGVMYLGWESLANVFFAVGTLLAPSGFGQGLAIPINIVFVALALAVLLWRYFKRHGPLKAEEWELGKREEWWPSKPS